MNILIVVAVVAAFGLLRFRRASLLLWAVAWWAGIYVLLRFGFTVPIPASVISIYMGIVSLAILAYLSSSQERRDEVSRPLVRFMTEKRYAPLLGAMAIAIPALAAANVYVADERPCRASLLSANDPSRIAFRDQGSRQDDPDRCWRQPLQIARNVESGRVPQTRRKRAPGLLSELRLLSRRQPGGQRHVRACAEPDPDQFRRRADAPESQRDVSVLANLQGRTGDARRRGAVGHGHARLGEVPEGRRDVGRDPLSLRFHGRRGPLCAPWRPRTNDPSPAVAWRCRCPARVVVGGNHGTSARAGSRRRDRGAAGVGQEPVSQILLAVPRRQRGRRRLRHAASAPPAPRLHHGQVQGSHDSRRSAPEPSGSRQHHQARHALHLDASVARVVRPGSVGSRVLPDDLLCRFFEPRASFPSQWSSRARRTPRTSPSSSGRSSTRRPAV